MAKPDPIAISKAIDAVSARYDADILAFIGFVAEPDDDLVLRFVESGKEPLYAQLDPIRMGEIERFVNIAQEYGERLASANVRPDTIKRLLTAYPSHEFVIDREEASDLFEKVDIPSDELELVAGTFIRLNHPTQESMNSFVQYINGQIAAPVEEASNATDVDKPRGEDDNFVSEEATASNRRPSPARNQRRIGPRKNPNGHGSVGQGEA